MGSDDTRGIDGSCISLGRIALMVMERKDGQNLMVLTIREPSAVVVYPCER